MAIIGMATETVIEEEDEGLHASIFAAVLAKAFSTNLPSSLNRSRDRVLSRFRDELWVESDRVLSRFRDELWVLSRFRDRPLGRCQRELNN